MFADDLVIQGPRPSAVMRLTLFICDIPSPTPHTLSSVLTMVFVLCGSITLWSAGTIGIPGVDLHLLRVITSHASACIDREISQAWNVTQQHVTQSYIRGSRLLKYFSIHYFLHFNSYQTILSRSMLCLYLSAQLFKEIMDWKLIIQSSESHPP